MLDSFRYRFITALAQDLREEFYNYLVRKEKPVLEVITNLLKSKEPDTVEWTLICLAHLFKILKPYVKKDFGAVFSLLLPLLESDNADYISNFAVECVAFVARDIADKEHFLRGILSKLSSRISEQPENMEQLTRSSGVLFFEIIRGVNGQFHSCAELYLRAYFELFAKLKAKQSDILYEVMSSMVSALLQHVTPVNMQIFWDITFHILAQSIDNPNSSKRVLLVMGQTLETRDGKYLSNSSKFATDLVKTIDAYEQKDECLSCAADLAAVLLLSKNVILSQVDASRVTRKVLSIPSTEIFESFVWNCVKYSQFESLILPEFLRYVDSKHFNISSLQLMAKIILYKAPLFEEVTAKTVYPIRLRSEKCLHKIESILTTVAKSDDCPTEFLLALIIYPHIVGANISTVLKHVNVRIQIHLNALKSSEEPESETVRTQNQRNIFILAILFDSQIHLRQLHKSAATIELKNTVHKLISFCSSKNYMQTLRIMDSLISFESVQTKETRNPEFNIDLFKMLHGQLSNNLTSPHQMIRKTTAHLLHQFSSQLEETSIYGVFYEIESIESTIGLYREQLLLLQRIEPNARLLSTLAKTYEPMKLDPLKYLFGFFHVNFKLLWKPISELIATYFSELTIEEFWTVFKMKLDETTSLQRETGSQATDEPKTLSDSESCLDEVFSQVCHTEERPVDLVNYRILLWRLIPSLGLLREIKNREIVTMFLDFIEHEYKRTIDRDTLTLNAHRKRKEKKSTKGRTSIDEDDLEDDDVDYGQNVPVGTQRTLSTMLQVFTNQNNPKALHREQELWNLYMELLSHRNADIQKLVLNCVAAYKHKYLQPYVDHLHDLVNDQKFKDGIMSFKLDKEDSLVQPEHRPHLMPIVMRILYSKLVTRVGGQKTSNQTRKAIIMRFLGSCHEDEVLIMLHMSFWMFESDFKEDALEMSRNVSDFLSVHLHIQYVSQ